VSGAGELTLAIAEARAFYDRFGAKQDTQAFYEDPALDALVARASFGEARSVCEFGCGTGRFAARLLAGELAPQATYFGCDLSSTMVRLARERLASHGERARVELSDGSPRLPLADGSVDRVVSTFVLDLLPDEVAVELVREAHRVLAQGGRLALLALTHGTTRLSRLVAGIWTRLYRWRPSWVGGCRPIRLEQRLDPRAWTIEANEVVVAFGVPSQVVVAAAVPTPDGESADDASA